MHARVLRLLASLLPLLALVSCGQPVPDGPNVVIVLIDTLRPDRLGLYGNERDTSPHLDRFSKQFYVFEDAQSPAPWTAPSLTSLMTSTYPDVHGVHGFPVPGRLGEGVTTLAQVLKRAGYSTAAFTEGGYAKGDFGLDRGFDTFPENPGDEESYTSNLSHPSRLAANVDRTIDWLKGRGRRPFFLFFHTYEVHSPPRAPEEDVRFFRSDFDIQREADAVRATIERWNASRELDAEGAHLLRRHAFLKGRNMGFDDMPQVDDHDALLARTKELGVPLDFDAGSSSPEDMAWVRDLYDAEIRYTDRQLQRLWDTLRDLGQLDHTVLVVTSDHGEALGEHQQVGRGHELHEELLHVVLMMRLPSDGPGHPPGVGEPRRIPDLVRTVDVMPTLLELSGVDTSGLAVQGKSLVPVLQGAPAGRPAFSHATMEDGGQDQRHTLRTERWRLIRDLAKDTTELYDLQADPGEDHDVAAEHPDVVADLSKLLDEQHARDLALHEKLGGTTEVSADPALLRDLKGLGYTGPDGADEGSGQPEKAQEKQPEKP